MIVLVDSEPETVVPTIPTGQVTTPPTRVVHDSELLNRVVDETEVTGTDDTLAPKVLLAPPPAVAPAPPPTVPEAPAPIPEEPVFTPAPALPPAETEALPVTDACAPAIVLLDAPVTVAPALAPIIPCPVSDVTTQAFSGSPPFVQALIDALFVVAPATCAVMPLILTDTVALNVAEIDGTEVAVLPTGFVFKDMLEEIAVDAKLVDVAEAIPGLEMDTDGEVRLDETTVDGKLMVVPGATLGLRVDNDGEARVEDSDAGDKLRDVPAAMLGLETDIEGELEGRLVDRALLTLVDVQLAETDVPRVDATWAFTGVVGRLGEVLVKVKDTCVFNVVLRREAVGTEMDVLEIETITNVDEKLNDVAVSTPVLGTGDRKFVDRSVLGTEMELLVGMFVVGSVIDNDVEESVGKLWVPRLVEETLAVGDETDMDTVKLEIVVPILGDVGDGLVERPKLGLVLAKEVDNDIEPRLPLGNDKLDSDKVSDVMLVPSEVIETDRVAEEAQLKLDSILDMPVVTTGRAPEME